MLKGGREIKKIEKVKPVDVHIEFGDGTFGYCINREEVDENTQIPVEELRIIARILSRMAIGMWAVVDKAYEEE